MFDDDIDLELGSKRKAWFGLSLACVIVSNLIVIPIALKAGVTILELIWLYWCESLILGGFQALRILGVEYTSITYLKESKRYRRKPKEAEEPPRVLGFLFVYGLTHAVFAKTVLSAHKEFQYTHALLVIGGVLFVQKILSSILSGHPWGREEGMREMTKLMSLPLVRLIPLIGIFLFVCKVPDRMENVVILTVVFVLCKTFADSIIHIFGKDMVE
jgi:hypothetical protein